MEIKCSGYYRKHYRCTTPFGKSIIDITKHSIENTEAGGMFCTSAVNSNRRSTEKDAYESSNFVWRSGYQVA